jgi:hypothetical protein
VPCLGEVMEPCASRLPLGRATWDCTTRCAPRRALGGTHGGNFPRTPSLDGTHPSRRQLRCRQPLLSKARAWRCKLNAWETELSSRPHVLAERIDRSPARLQCFNGLVSHGFQVASNVRLISISGSPHFLQAQSARASSGPRRPHSPPRRTGPRRHKQGRYLMNDRSLEISISCFSLVY